MAPLKIKEIYVEKRNLRNKNSDNFESFIAQFIESHNGLVECKEIEPDCLQISFSEARLSDINFIDLINKIGELCYSIEMSFYV